MGRRNWVQKEEGLYADEKTGFQVKVETLPCDNPKRTNERCTLSKDGNAVAQAEISRRIKQTIKRTALRWANKQIREMKKATATTAAA